MIFTGAYFAFNFKMQREPLVPPPDALVIERGQSGEFLTCWVTWGLDDTGYPSFQDAKGRRIALKRGLPYFTIQVQDGNARAAARSVGIDPDRCLGIEPPDMGASVEH